MLPEVRARAAAPSMAGAVRRGRNRRETPSTQKREAGAAGARAGRKGRREQQAHAREKGRRRRRLTRSGIDELDTARFSPTRFWPSLSASLLTSTPFRGQEMVSLFSLLSLHLFECHVSKMMRWQGN